MTIINRALGIDLGTTNSAVAMMRPAGDDLWLLEDQLRRKTFPSMVGWDDQNAAFITGYEAWNRRAMQPAPLASVKRKMGSQQRLGLADHRLLPEEVAAKILARLVDDMGDFVAAKSDEQFELDRAVITVPAYFDAPQIEATKRAGQIAGLEVVGLLQEPTAAAMYYAWKHGIGDGTFLVYDLGGGTFDVSVIRSLMGEYQVLAIDGDNYLGGDDFDRRLADYFRQTLVDQGYQLDLDIADDADDRRRFSMLERVARQTKEALSSSQVQYVGRRDLFDDQLGQPVTLDMEVGRADFESLIDDLVDQSIEACRRAVAQASEQADVELADIDHVLLVGGSTRVPLVQQKVADALCATSGAERPLIDDPDTCVGLGAAIHAANLAGVQWRRGADHADADHADADHADTDHPDADDSRLTITSSLSTRQQTLPLIGRLSGPYPPTIRSAALVGPGGEVVGATRLTPPAERSAGEPLSFDIDAVDLDAPGRREFRLEFCDEKGDARTTFDIFLERLDPEAPFRPTGSALSNPTVLAKDIYLEVAGDQRPQRAKLLGQGTSLPARESFRFYTADRSGTVLLRLFQNRYPIRTIQLDVPADTELGTPVELSIELDQSMTMVATGQVRGQSFRAQIDAPAAPEIRQWDAIETLLDQVEQTRQKLWGMEAKRFAKRVDSLVAGIRETARTDPDKLQVLVRRLEGALEDYRNQQAGLAPDWSRYSTLSNTIRRVVYRGEDTQLLGRDLEAWHDFLDTLDRRAKAAWESQVQAQWTQIFDQVQATWESLAQEEYRFHAADTSEYVQRLYLALSRRAAELDEAIDQFTVSSNPDIEEIQRHAMLRLRADLEDDLQEPLDDVDPDQAPAELKPKLARLSETAASLETRLDELPLLGLVRR